MVAYILQRVQYIIYVGPTTLAQKLMYGLQSNVIYFVSFEEEWYK